MQKDEVIFSSSLNMNKFNFYFFFLIIGICSQDLFGQLNNNYESNSTTSLVQRITEKGYQNIVTQKTEQELVIYYENRVRRFEPSAIIELVQIISEEELIKEVQEIRLVAQRMRIPVLTVMFKSEDLVKWKSGTLPLETFVETFIVEQGGTRLPKTLVANSGNFSVELELKPEIGLGLGGFPDPVIHRFFLLPTINVFLWKGAQLKSEIILPISSEFDIIGERVVRPGIVSFSQNIQLPKQLWLQASLGYFSKNRFGGRLSFAKYFFNGSLTLIGQIGYTGYASYPRKINLEEAVKGWEYSTPNYYDYNVGVNYWFNEWNTRVRLEYGRALFNKEQLKFTCLQRFNEVDIGFFALQTQRGNNFGMILNLPIAPKKYWKPKRISVRPAKTLNYTYQATQATVESYETGISILNINRQLNPAFIKKQLLLLRRWEED